MENPMETKRFQPTKREIEMAISQAQQHLSSARQSIRKDEFVGTLAALGEADRAVEKVSEMVSNRWAAVDHHRESLIEYHETRLRELRTAPEAVNEARALRVINNDD